jgi:hypothetical protein
MATPYTPLEPSSITALSSVGASTNVSDASFAGITTFVYSLFFIGIIGAAFYRYTLAGMFRMEASESGIRKSNEIFKRVTLGLLGVFSLFILLFTVNKGLVTGDVPLGNLKSGGQTSGGQVAQPPSPAVGAPGTGDGRAEAIQQDAAVRQQLTSQGITVNKPVCPNPSATDCTTIGGVHPDTISMLLRLRTTCNTPYTVTGGTEKGHAENGTHGPGRPAVDLSFGNQTLNTCITTSEKATPNPIPGYCVNAYKKLGYIFCQTSKPHWHVYK